MSISPSRTVLVVNDDPDHASFLSLLLEQSGFVPAIAVDGIDGLDKARQYRPDVIVCDVTMPRMDGFDLCRAVRTDERLRETPVLLVTALRKDSDSLVEGLSAGADDFIELPCDPIRLVAKVTRLAKRRLVELESKMRLRALHVALADLVIVLDGDGRVHSVEPTKRGVLDRPAAEMIGRTLDSVMPEHADRFLSEIHRALASGQPHDVEYWLEVDGTMKWFEATISPLSDHTVYWVARDTTERKGRRAQTRAGGEDGGSGQTGGRYCPRFQQHPDGDRRVRRARGARSAADQSAPSRHRGDSQGGDASVDPDTAAAVFQPKNRCCDQSSWT